MLKKLNLYHFILTTQATITFEKGFNVISGETGAGKTMLLQALYLIMGQKADVELIRKGEDRAYIEAIFDIGEQKEVSHLLDNAGIEAIYGEDLIIKRELSSDGKNRIFINNQQTTLYVLKELADHLVEIVGQHSQILIKQPSFQREILDRFCHALPALNDYEIAYSELQVLKQKLESLESSPKLHEDRLYFLKEELEDIHKTAYKANEEEELLEVYTSLSNFHEILEKGSSVAASLSNDSEWMSSFYHLKKTLEDICKLDPHFESIFEIFSEAENKLNDTAFEIEKHLSSMDHDPMKLQEIEERLSQIKRFKRKFGAHLEDLTSYEKTLLKSIESAEMRHTHIEALKQAIHDKQSSVEKLAAALHEKRSKGATILSKKIKKQLEILNMKGSDFNIEVKRASLTSYGGDLIEFLLEANPGEGFSLIQDSASGGELSRLVLSLKIQLASLEHGKLLILDEIDANIGGTTATLVGETLKTLGTTRQVLCITHFPQVALHADHHLKIIKSPKSGRVQTEVLILNEEEKKEELLRMLGGELSFISTESQEASK